MLADVGCSFVEIGHTERRRQFGETDVAVNAKTRLILDNGMRPVICVGDTAEEKALDAAVETNLRQARMALAGLSAEERGRCILAYEPVWAIGEGGTPATPDEAATVHDPLKNAFPDTPVIYGGSVNPENCTGFAALASVDGLFIGRSAWQAEGLLDIIGRALAARS
jgi:triosephosphate isomerase